MVQKNLPVWPKAHHVAWLVAGLLVMKDLGCLYYANTVSEYAECIAETYKMVK